MTPENVEKVREHYNHFMYRALLNATKQSLYNLKKRLSTAKSPPGMFGGPGGSIGGGSKMLDFASLVSSKVLKNKPCFEGMKLCSFWKLLFLFF